MMFWRKPAKKIVIDENKELISIPFIDLKKRINQSVNSINDLGREGLVESLSESISKIKLCLNDLMSKNVGDGFNQALIISAESSRKKIIDSLNELITLEVPKTLLGINVFSIKAVELINECSAGINNSIHAQVIFRNETNNLLSALDSLKDEINELNNAVSERNAQLSNFKELIDEVKSLNEAIKNLDLIKDEEFTMRKKISDYEKDKIFLSAEISRIKSIDKFTESKRAEDALKTINSKKLELESIAGSAVAKFSRALRKEFNNDEFTKEFLTNPLLYSCNNTSIFNDRIKKLSKAFKDDKKIISAINDESFKNCIKEYKELLLTERELNNADFGIIKKSNAFERRLMELNQKINSDVKVLDSFKDRISNQKQEIDAIKAKVEALASECYEEKVRINI